MNELPSNAIAITTTVRHITLPKGERVEFEYVTSVVVQTHKVAEIEPIIQMCWRETLAQLMSSS